MKILERHEPTTAAVPLKLFNYRRFRTVLFVRRRILYAASGDDYAHSLNPVSRTPAAFLPERRSHSRYVTIWKNLYRLYALVLWLLVL